MAQGGSTAWDTLADADRESSYTPLLRQEGDTWIVEFAAGVNTELSRVEAAKAEFFGLLRVTSTLPGTPALIHQGRFNLTSTTARASLCKYLEQRAGAIDWPEVIEQTCLRVLDRLREGQPVVRLRDVPVREQARYRIAPLVLEGLPTILFGAGGSGKSQLAAMLAMGVHDAIEPLGRMGLVAEQGPALVCDWELDAVTYREMCAPIAAGMDLVAMPNIHYRQCLAPLVEEASAIGRYIDKEGIAFVVVDSLGYAIGGDKTSQELTMRMFSAIRSWKTTVLCIDHITNDEANGNRPYGSAYTGNSARAMWRVRASQEDGSSELSLGLFQTKANFGKQRPVGFRMSFGDGAVLVTREDVKEVPAFQESLPAKVRIKSALLNAREPQSEDQLAERTGLTKASVRARLSELQKAGEVLHLEAPSGTNYTRRWTLLSKREDDGT